MLSLLLAGSLIAPAEARIASCPDNMDHGCPCDGNDIWPSPCDEYRCEQSSLDGRCGRWPVKPYQSF